MFFPGQALDGIGPPSWRMIATVWRNLGLRSCVSDHLQDFPHCRPVLGRDADTGHRNVEERLELLLWRLISWSWVIPRLSLLLPNWSHPAGNIRAMLLHQVLERGLTCKELQQQHPEAIYVALLVHRPPDVSALWGPIEKRSSTGLLEGVGIPEWGEPIVCEAGLKVGPE